MEVCSHPAMSKCILINPAKSTVTLQDLPSDLKAMQAMVGGWLTIGAGLRAGDILYVDEEAKLRNPLAPTFAIEGHRLWGNAVVVSIDPDSGADCNPKSTLQAIAAAVVFSK